MNDPKRIIFIGELGWCARCRRVGTTKIFLIEYFDFSEVVHMCGECKANRDRVLYVDKPMAYEIPRDFFEILRIIRE